MNTQKPDDFPGTQKDWEEHGAYIDSLCKPEPEMRHLIRGAGGKLIDVTPSHGDTEE